MESAFATPLPFRESASSGVADLCGVTPTSAIYSCWSSVLSPNNYLNFTLYLACKIISAMLKVAETIYFIRRPFTGSLIV